MRDEHADREKIAKESQCGSRLPRNLMEILEEAPPKQKRHIA
jgi:hypothetical protein